MGIEIGIAEIPAILDDLTQNSSIATTTREGTTTTTTAIPKPKTENNLNYQSGVNFH